MVVLSIVLSLFKIGTRAPPVRILTPRGAPYPHQMSHLSRALLPSTFPSTNRNPSPERYSETKLKERNRVMESR
jgi:hypothetical protein